MGTRRHFSVLTFAQAAWLLLSVYVLVFEQRVIGGRPGPLRAESSERG